MRQNAVMIYIFYNYFSGSYISTHINKQTVDFIHLDLSLNTEPISSPRSIVKRGSL